MLHGLEYGGQGYSPSIDDIRWIAVRRSDSKVPCSFRKEDRPPEMTPNSSSDIMET